MDYKYENRFYKKFGEYKSIFTNFNFKSYYTFDY